MHRPLLRSIAQGSLSLIAVSFASSLQAQNQASFTVTGTGCAGTNGVPFLTPSSGALPQVGTVFGVEVGNLPPNIADTVFMMVGFIPLTNPVSLDGIGMPGCVLGVAPAVFEPITKIGTTARWSVSIPASASVIGLTFDTQAFVFDRPFPAPFPNALGATVSDIGTGTIGNAIVNREITETFDTPVSFDSGVSSANWAGGTLTPKEIGGSGIHGSFDITALPLGEGPNEHVWDTDVPLIVPASSTLLRRGPLTINNARAEFADFIIPFGKTLRLVGSAAPVFRVSGVVQIDGTVDLGGEPGAPGLGALGGVGGRGGAGGGNGGRGADPHLPTFPPNVVGLTPSNNGSRGDNLAAPAGSGYAGSVIGSGGRGAPGFPASGSHSDVNTLIQGFYSSQQIPGGGGGGYLVRGADGSIPVLLAPTANPPTVSGPAVGGAFVAFTTPPVGVDGIDHFTVGGSGGGGGGSTSTLVRPAILSPIWMRWTDGIGGAGGGGAIGFRVGGAFVVTSVGSIVARGGDGADSLGNTWSDRGSSVGGGGSGGSVVIQSDGQFVQAGSIDVRGGRGGIRTCAAPGGVRGESRGGDGAPGFVRVERDMTTTADLGILGGITAGANNVGPLASRDASAMARSRWYSMQSVAGARVNYYEIDVTIDGVATMFTDNPAAPNPTGSGTPVQIWLQGADVDPVTLRPTSAPGTWAQSAAGIGSPTGFRFLVFFDRTTAQSIVIDEVRLNYDG